MTTRERIQRLAEQDGLTYEEAEDILFDAAEAENDRRRDDALLNDNDRFNSEIQLANLDD